MNNMCCKILCILIFCDGCSEVPWQTKEPLFGKWFLSVAVENYCCIGDFKLSILVGGRVSFSPVELLFTIE